MLGTTNRLRNNPGKALQNVAVVVPKGGDFRRKHFQNPNHFASAPFDRTGNQRPNPERSATLAIYA